MENNLKKKKEKKKEPSKHFRSSSVRKTHYTNIRILFSTQILKTIFLTYFLEIILFLFIIKKVFKIPFILFIIKNKIYCEKTTYF